MKSRYFYLGLILTIGFASLVTCGNLPGKSDEETGTDTGGTTTIPTYTVSYNGNGSTGGSAPADGGKYKEGQTVTVLGNPGSLAKTGNAYIGWNTKADGTGTAYAQSSTFVMGKADVTLYAAWVLPGSPDPSFDPGAGATDIWTVVLQADGKILLGGQFWTYYDTTVKRFYTRANADGSLDAAFNAGGIGFDGIIYASALLADGKSLACGQFTNYDGTSAGCVARINTDGSLDTAFNSGGAGADSIVRACALQSDGRILIGGNFTTYNGTSRISIARLNADGTLDATFDPGTGANNNVCAIAVQSDGKILISGNFSTYNGTSITRIARINSDGTLDTAFNSGGSGMNSVANTITIQSDGKAVLSGAFTTYNGTSRNRIARINADGTLDTAFDPGTGANNAFRGHAVQSDGKILVGGDFTTYGGEARKYVVRLNTDGSLDATFNAASYANNIVYAFAFPSPGKILLVGYFTNYGGTTWNAIARIYQ